MSDLVLRTRVTITKRNLRRIRDLGDTLSSRATDLRSYLLFPDTLQKKLNSLQNHCGDLLREARECRKQHPDLYKGLKELNEKIDSIYEDLNSSQDEAKQVRRELFQFEELELDVQDFLAKRARETEDSLTKENYFKKREQIESFFAEYVDLLRAIALRSAGFQEQDSQLSDIFRIADRLPRLWGRIEGWEWQSLTVPSDTELNRKSQAMMLRLGFPEWTLWALPFVQNEFAHVYVARGAGPASWKVTSPRSATLLAEALASLVTGPAYACAALLVRLDPAAVTEPSATVALRSATIIASLIASLDRVAGGSETPLDDLIERLRMEWREAVKFAGGDPEAFDEAMDDPEVDVAVRQAQEIVLGMGESRRPAWADHWATISEWAELLRQDRAAEIALEEAGDDYRRRALVFLLDAAWLARVGPGPEADAPEDKLDIVASGAIKRMLEIVEPAAPLTEASPGKVPKVRPNPR
jgi:hypothetical protein